MLGRSNVTFNYNDLLSTPKELTGDYVKCLIYGKAGVGKTKLLEQLALINLRDCSK